MAIKPTVVLRAAAAAGLAAAAKMATVFKAAGGLKMGAAGAAMAAAAAAATGSRKKADNQSWRQLEIPTPIPGHGHQLVVQKKVIERTMWVVLVGDFCSTFCLSDGYWCAHEFCNWWFSLDPSEVAKHEDGFLRTQVFVGFVLESGVLQRTRWGQAWPLSSFRCSMKWSLCQSFSQNDNDEIDSIGQAFHSVCIGFGKEVKGADAKWFQTACGLGLIRIAVLTGRPSLLPPVAYSFNRRTEIKWFNDRIFQQWYISLKACKLSSFANLTDSYAIFLMNS